MKKKFGVWVSSGSGKDGWSSRDKKPTPGVFNRAEFDTLAEAEELAIQRREIHPHATFEAKEILS